MITNDLPGVNGKIEPSLARQGCIKLPIQPKPGRGVSPKRPCLGGSGRLGEASPPELDAALLARKTGRGWNHSPTKCAVMAREWGVRRCSQR